MNKEVYLHVGTHKTGSTSIQYALSSSAKALKINGYRYLESGCLHNLFRERDYSQNLVKRYKKIFLCGRKICLTIASM